MQISGTRYSCTRSTFAKHMLSVKERLVLYNTFNLDTSWFVRVNIAIENGKSSRKALGRNNYEQIAKNRYHISVDESKTEL